ncbi:hypothetical protein CC78DRAFT_574511 [Lojkania enalia]|uniref:Uncharacterized protein n=1 Tax=Lojkania enalia TaxID=147567 RepID=A0A9P4TQP1_9PLEO|nr:hypothetical protein CC78DRAFT_574511 [Didymosphaeria enalia]
MSLQNEKLSSNPSLADIGTLNLEQECALINAFWPHLHLVHHDYIRDDYEAFFDFIGKTFRNLHPHASKLAIQELSGLIAIVKNLRDNRCLAQKEFIKYVKEDFSTSDCAAITRSIEVAVQIWLGIYVYSRKFSISPRNPRDSQVEWDDDQSLQGIIEAQFPGRLGKIELPDSLLDESFTAVNLKSICRLNIRWTNHIIDHLKLEGPRGQRTLSVYRHKICLINHRKDPAQNLILKDVLDEAIRTLDLLFPFGDPKTEQFLRNENVHFRTTSPLELSRAAALKESKYWRNNLAQLSRILHGPPEDVAQTLLDTRNVSQFATLWVAIFGVFLLTILFRIFTTVYSIKQYRIAIQSYELALALACQQTIKPISGFCG